eukprot:scaffold54025_cov66-Cyclotella_meneghiniana.AAC.1
MERQCKITFDEVGAEIKGSGLIAEYSCELDSALPRSVPKAGCRSPDINRIQSQALSRNNLTVDTLPEQKFMDERNSCGFYGVAFQKTNM